MTYPHGSPIWYELTSPDPDAAKAFYEQVIGWTIHDADPSGMDYRMIDTGDQNFVGGLAGMAGERPPGVGPGWKFYLCVDDTDAIVTRITAAGGSLITGPHDLPGVGRLALVADPQGIPFYVMRGAIDATSSVWDRTAMGKCSWNELNTTDQSAANAFYAEMFGWTYPDKMPMGEMGDYVFVQAGDETIGATMNAPPGAPAAWQFYFRTTDIDAAATKVTDGGGTVHAGPMDVPGGDRIIVASDPHGAMFGVVAAAAGGAA
ncbi:VOC family protein [Sphingomonas endolithica]|uniref:VOC family protein n=1 Tax=Sphingomonas endolithica TaxID=2972485 RepID=UPI0021B0187E|nr:VOC family protein [Sphingomonas sp. ZFBP2030]